MNGETYKIGSLFEEYPAKIVTVNDSKAWAAWFDATAKHYYAGLRSEVEKDLQSIAEKVGKTPPQLQILRADHGSEANRLSKERGSRCLETGCRSAIQGAV